MGKFNDSVKKMRADRSVKAHALAKSIGCGTNVKKDWDDNEDVYSDDISSRARNENTELTQDNHEFHKRQLLGVLEEIDTRKFDAVDVLKGILDTLDNMPSADHYANMSYDDIVNAIRGYRDTLETMSDSAENALKSFANYNADALSYAQGASDYGYGDAYPFKDSSSKKSVSKSYDGPGPEQMDGAYAVYEQGTDKLLETFDTRQEANDFIQGFSAAEGTMCYLAPNPKIASAKKGIVKSAGDMSDARRKGRL